MPRLIVYFLQQDIIMILQNIDTVKILVKIIPPRPEFPRKNLTTVTLLKLIIKVLLLNLIPAITAQKIHTIISASIKQTKARCRLIGSIKEYEILGETFI